MSWIPLKNPILKAFSSRREHFKDKPKKKIPYMFGKQQLRNEPQTKIKNSLLTASISFHAYYILFSLCLSSFKRQILPCTIIVIS